MTDYERCTDCGHGIDTDHDSRAMDDSCTACPDGVCKARPTYRAVPDADFGTVYRTSDGSTFEHEWQAQLHADKEA